LEGVVYTKIFGGGSGLGAPCAADVGRCIMPKSKPTKKSLPTMVQRIDIDQLAIEQGVPENSLENLNGDFWPEDEDIDEFIAKVRQWRQEDILISAKKEKKRQ